MDGKEIGDPTEVALINLAHNFWVEETTYRAQHPRLAEIAFDSDRKLMSTMHKLDGVYTLCTKGAFPQRQHHDSRWSSPNHRRR